MCRVFNPSGNNLLTRGSRTLTLLINYADKAKSPSISTARVVLNILQDHYPERLGKALIIKIPFYINAFFKIIMPFVDPVTREKVKFNPEVTKDGYFTPEMLMSGSWDGACDFEYEHEKYWPALVSLCEERKKAWLQGWRALGGTVGIKEWDYKREGAEQTPAEDHSAIGVAVSCDEKKAVEDALQNGHANGSAPEAAAVNLA